MNAAEARERLITARGQRRREEVAAAVGISASALWAYERGTRTPRDSVKLALARYYGRSVGELFFEEKAPPPKGEGAPIT